MTDFNAGQMIQSEEDSNWEACRVTFHKAHPTRLSSNYESCEDGEWECPGCPWGNKSGKGIKMTDKQLETLKQLGELGCYATMDTSLCKAAYDEIMRLRERLASEELAGVVVCDAIRARSTK